MKKIIWLIIVLCGFVLNLQAQRSSVVELSKYAQEEYQGTLYRVRNFHTTQDKQPALVIYLHGASGRGDDNTSQMKQGGIKLIEDYLVSHKMNACFIVPQCPTGYIWAGDPESPAYIQNLIPLIDYIVKEKKIDKSRIYLLGVSAGGQGIWKLTAAYPDRFAACLVASGQAIGYQAQDFGKTPFYITVGSEEKNRVPRLSRWYRELNRSISDVRFDILQGLGHGEACTQAFTEERLDWIFSHK